MCCFRALARRIVRMNIAALVDDEVMRHIALFGCVKNADPLVQHMLKTSEEPILRFRREWMRAVALRQHLEAERRQGKINEQRKAIPDAKLPNMRRSAVVDSHLSSEILHYNQSATWNDKKFLGDVKREAPAIFSK